MITSEVKHKGSKTKDLASALVLFVRKYFFFFYNNLQNMFAYENKQVCVYIFALLLFPF